jgi:ACS family hexuronate transporter-like MFS transporter
VLTRRAAWGVALVATLTMTVSYIDRTTLAVLAPSVTKALDISEQAYGWLTSAFSIAYLLATPLSGWWIDRIGARRGLVASILVWTTVAALHAIVPGFGVLFALRIALGVAEGPSFPGSAQTIQRVLPPAERARGFGVLFTGSSIGGMIAPPLASYLYDVGGWRFAFVGTALVGLVWIPLWLVVTRPAAARAQLDAVVIDEHAARPTLLELVRHPTMVRALLAIFATAPLFGIALAWGAKYLDRTFGVAQEDVGRYLWLPPLMFDLGAVFFGDQASRRRRRTDQPARLLMAIGICLAMTLVFLPWVRSPWEASVLVGISLAGGGAVYTLATAECLSHMPPHSVSFAGGVLAGAQSLALIIVNPLIGASVDHYGDYDVAAIAIGLWTIPGPAIWILSRPRA